jgi:hypothetical protein
MAGIEEAGRNSNWALYEGQKSIAGIFEMSDGPHQTRVGASTQPNTEYVHTTTYGW